MFSLQRSLSNIAMVLLLGCAPWRCLAADSSTNTLPFAMEQEMFGTWQGFQGERSFGCVGVTGLKLRIYDGLKLTVEETVPGSPADGKFKKGEVVLGVNGIALQGHSPFLVFGSALTEAEAKDGRLIFEVQAAGGQATRLVEVKIPVLGAYSETWPLNCAKSRTIIRQAAAFYANTRKYADNCDADRPDQMTAHGMGGALASLFLLSTGDDQYLPRVKQYVDELGTNVQTIGDNTWDNGYNGMLCAEYYLRTGDKGALPVLQYYCDNARERQFYGAGWGQWGKSLNPAYTSGGLMNPAGTQVATSLLLAKECGVNVDEATMLGALRQWYRFVGHGNVPYGDHRAEGGVGSNGKDGMTAAMMQVASGTAGNVDVYRQARNYMSLSTLLGYPRLVSGHADQGRGDGIWRGIASSYMLDVKPADYHAAMKTLRWWFDISRRPSGGLGMAMGTRFDDEGSGAGLALAYTAPRKTLRITGAPLSRFAKAYKLPEQLWGRPADRAFLSIEPGPAYGHDGRLEPIHVALRILGDGYFTDTNAAAAVPRSEILKNAHHPYYMIRAQAGKALLRLGAYDELEKMLQDKDPRVRRAALDGLTDYRYWFAMGKQPIATAQFTPAMLASIRKMLADPNEAIYVVDGALMALSRAPAAAIVESLPLILPWTTHEDWWLRQSSFLALSGAAGDAAQLPKVLPVMLDILTHETRTMARDGMQYRLVDLLKANPVESPMGRQIAAGLQRMVKEHEILSGPRSAEGVYSVIEVAAAAVKEDPGCALAMARIILDRFAQLDSGQIAKMVDKLLPACEKLKGEARETLAGLLYGDYRTELIRRMEAGDSGVPLSSILALTQLESPELGWQAVGKTGTTGRVWKFMSFDPPPQERLLPREGNRFRDVTLPAGLTNWYQPNFDDAQWTSGQGPIGTGVYEPKRGKKTSIANHADWGAGEFLLMRTTIDLAAVDCDFYRVRMLAKMGYRIYLNGFEIHNYPWWQDSPIYRVIQLGTNSVPYLKPGANVLAIYANAGYGKDGERIGQADACFEGLKKADLLGKGKSEGPAAK